MTGFGKALESAFQAAMDYEREMALVNAVTVAATRAVWAMEAHAVRMEVTAYMLEAGHRGIGPAAREAGLGARFYVRGALDPRFSDRARAARYARAIFTRHRGAALEFMRGLADREDGRPDLSHTHRSWGDTNVAVVIR